MSGRGVPGAYHSESDDGGLGAIFDDSMDEDDEFDPDFEPSAESAAGDDIVIEGLDDDDDDEEEEEDDQDGEGQSQGTGGGNATGGLQLAYDPSTGRLVIVDEQGRGTLLTENHLTGTNYNLSTLRALIARQFSSRTALDLDQDDSDDGEEWEDEDDGSYWGPTKQKRKKYYDIPTEPQEAGMALEQSGEFGPVSLKYRAAKRKFSEYSPNVAELMRKREIGIFNQPRTEFGDATVPNSAGTEVAQFTSKVYSGQYSQDGSFFYAACQDFCVYLYDTRRPPKVGAKSVNDSFQPSRTGRRFGYDWQHRTSLRTIKIVKAHARNQRWTITDANLSPKNDLLIYSSITPRVHLVKTEQGSEWETEDHEQLTLDFASRTRGDPHFGIWSIRFSNDAKEIVAGGTSGQVLVYDVEAQRSVLRVDAHMDDVNAVAFADTASPHLLLSGSDDTFVRVWDRRSLSGERASGHLVGHTEGITFLAPKGDGRYVISNGKDQGCKLFDIRKMMSEESFDKNRLDRVSYSIPNWDYRQSYYAKPRYKQHPHDVSVMTYRGHSVLRTLIRCHFSPAETTNQRYIYSGSSDGKIHIWSLDGRIVSVLDRRNTIGLIDPESGDYNDPNSQAPDAPPHKSYGSTVRDVSWHPYEPSLLSTAWDGRAGVEGSIAKHEWRARVGETLEDSLERQRLEASR